MRVTPRTAAEIEQHAVALLISCSYEAPSDLATEARWRSARRTSNTHIVFTESRKFPITFSTIGPAKSQEVVVKEILIPVSGNRAPDYILVRLDDRVRAFAKYNPEALFALQKCLLAVLAGSASTGRPDEASYAAIIKERDTVLFEILATREKMRSSGVDDGKAIEAAQLALYSFRRDVAATTAEKIKNQELIVGVFEQQLAFMQSRVLSGTATALDILEAKAPLLEARQILAELRLKEKAG